MLAVQQGFRTRPAGAKEIEGSSWEAVCIALRGGPGEGRCGRMG